MILAHVSLRLSADSHANIITHVHRCADAHHRDGIGNVVHERTLLINYDETIRLECRGESRTRKTACLLDLYRAGLCVPWYVALAH